MGRWVLGVLAVVGAALLGATRVSQAPSLVTFDSAPRDSHLAVRVGDPISFAVAAEGALGLTWSLGDVEVSHDVAWLYVPTPEDVGRRTVQLVVVGENGIPHTRTWELAVARAVAPEVVEVMPPAGAVALSANDPATFRCRARLATAGPSDLLRFEWLVNDRVAFTEDHPASDGVSEFPLATAEAGVHRVSVRVTKNERIASTVQWIVDVAAPPPGLVATANAKERPTPPPAIPAWSGSPTPSIPAVVPAALHDTGDIAAAPPPDPDHDAGLPVLQRIDVESGSALTVRIRLSAPVVSRAATLPAGGGAPNRLYIDLPGAQLGPSAAPVVGGAGTLLRVRSGQFDATTARVVLDLAAPVPFAVESDGTTVTVRLEPPAQVVRAPRPARVAETPTPPPTDMAEVSPPGAPALPPPVAVAEVPAPPVAAPPPVVAEAYLPPSPPPAAAPSTPASLPARTLPVIVVDAGHGGRDPGAAGVGGVLEKDVVLQVAQRLATVLPQLFPVEVFMTRTDDSFVPIDGRLAMTGDGPALFLSLHANACADPSPRGMEIFYGGGRVRTASTQGSDPRAALLGRSLYRALNERLGAVRHAAQPAGFGVLVRNHVPSALVEIGYLTTREDAVQAQDAHYQDQLANALAEGVGAFLRASAPPL